MHTSNIDPKQIGYSWVPPGIVTSSKVNSCNIKNNLNVKMKCDFNCNFVDFIFRYKNISIYYQGTKCQKLEVLERDIELDN